VSILRKDYCLDVGEIYGLGDLNLFLENRDDIVYPQVNQENPALPLFTGIIEQDVVVNGKTNKSIVYIPKNYPISGGGIFVFPDNGITSETWLKSSNYIDLSEEFSVALIVMQAPNDDWNKKDIQTEMDYAVAVFKASLSRKYFSLNESTYYVLGQGAGAYIATAFTLLHSTIISALVADGDITLHADLLNQLGKVRSDRNPLQSKTEVQVCAWLVGGEDVLSNPVTRVFQKACNAIDEGLSNAYAKVFRQKMSTIKATLDGLPIAEVWVSEAENLKAKSENELHLEMFSFLLRLKKWLGIGNGDYRALRDYSDMGLFRKTKEIGGLEREWYLFIPETYKKDPTQKLPLVVAIHGYSCTGKLYAENSEWHNVANKRDFFLIYPSAYPSNEGMGNKTVPLPTWNSIGIQTSIDDMQYFREIIDDFTSTYPVDEERIYVSGHSNGSLMTQKLMEEMPLKFAAFAPQGAQYHLDLGNNPYGNDKNIPKDGIIRPVWLMMGHEDIGCGDTVEKGLANDLFIEMMCNVNDLDRNKGSFLKNGKYKTWTFADESGVPLLKFTGVDDLPHAYTPEMAYMFYDQFLCHFRRKADGTIVYTL
jgi:pimeloyl-ACP methyl ester carboxylesterase